ncbi:MAG TPA: efflux RND transporter periplasmic adaptor subunit [Verrucomicrobiae bacterium]|jgi:multidrug efflux system membrane fusion protein|nr:efflux RND transporter periplasmic adaptor subunit [Verrucomicrobiae bacterium]
MHIKIQFKAALTATAIALLLTGCQKSAPGAEAAAPPPAPVTVNQPISKEVTEWDEYQGRIEPVASVEVRARVNGYLESIHFTDGAEVKQGDLLFVIDPRPYQAELDRAQAELAEAQTRFELASNDFVRGQRLLKAKAISEEEADARAKAEREAAAAIQSSAASVEMAKLNMDYTHVTAPISGRIGRKMITVGNLVNASQGESTLLATIVSMDPIYCYFDADEGAILKYQKLAREGQEASLNGGKVPCEVELGNESGFPHRGLLDFVDNHVDSQTGTLEVRALLENHDRILQPGFFARARVPGSSKYAALLIPDLAVGTDQSQKFVFIVDDKDMVQYVPVSLGPLVDGLRVVRSGLKPNDWVVVNGLMTIRPGVKVAATHATATAMNSTAALSQ